MSIGGEVTPYQTPRTKKADGGSPPSVKNPFFNPKTKKMNSYRIISGAFTTGEGAQGNFSGYTALGKRIHIFKRQMEALGYTADNAPTAEDFPLFVIAEEKLIPKLDKNRQPLTDPTTGEQLTSVRLTATAVFKNKEEIVDACVEESTLGAEIKDSIAKAASSKGLTQEVVNQLVAAF